MRWIWITLPDRTLGLAHGFVPKDSIREFEQASSLVQSMHEVLQSQESSRLAVEAQAGKLLEAAREEGRREAELLVDSAREEAAHLRRIARDEGYAAGMAEATLEWHRRRHAAASDEASALAGQRAAMVRIICTAVARIISSESPRSLYDKALAQVGDLMAGRAAGVLKVHPERLECARQAAEQAQRTGDASWVIRVVADPSLGEGGCVFESDHGTLDASLETQLQALSQALGEVLGRALDDGQADLSSASPSDGPEDGGEVSDAAVHGGVDARAHDAEAAA